MSNVCVLSQISDLQNSLSAERVKNKLSDEYLRNAQDNVGFKLLYYTFNVIHRVTSQVENLRNKVDGLEGENNDIRKEVEKLKNDKLEQDQEHSYRVCILLNKFAFLFTLVL